MSEEVQVNLTGWKAVAAIAVLFAVGGFQMIRPGVGFMGGGPKDVVKRWLADKYDTGRFETALAGASADMSEEAAQKLLAAAREEMAMSKVEITGMSARRRGDDEYIVRVEFLVAGKPPPDGKSVRYLLVRKHDVTGWEVRFEDSAFSYYSAFGF
ncbi:MAG: hypothetical protein WC728_03535 [Elusimicrobiota bacterium]